MSSVFHFEMRLIVAVRRSCFMVFVSEGVVTICGDKLCATARTIINVMRGASASASASASAPAPAIASASASAEIPNVLEQWLYTTQPNAQSCSGSWDVNHAQRFVPCVTGAISRSS